MSNKKPKWQQEGFKDDGTLACLGLTTNRESKTFTNAVKTQQELAGREFFILDGFDDLKIGGVKKALFKMAFDLNAPENECYKVWTGSRECMDVISALIEHDLFPRKVRLVANKRGGYHFE